MDVADASPVSIFEGGTPFTPEGLGVTDEAPVDVSVLLVAGSVPFVALGAGFVEGTFLSIRSFFVMLPTLTDRTVAAALEFAADAASFMAFLQAK